jgi:cytosine/uracil/thiamine/allantoin permease
VGEFARLAFIERPELSSYTTHVGILGNVFSPIAGVLIVDYLLVKRARIDLVALFEPTGAPYWYWNGVNPVAVVWTALSFLAYMFVIPAEWIRVVVTLLADYGSDPPHIPRGPSWLR